jgi:hypothetical protein
MGVEHLDELGEVGQRSGEAIDLIDDDHVDPFGLHLQEELLQCGTLYRSTGKAAVVIAGSNQRPTLMGLALDVGFGSFPLGVEGVELLLQPRVGGDPSVDRAA